MLIHFRHEGSFRFVPKVDGLLAGSNVFFTQKGRFAERGQDGPIGLTVRLSR